MSEQRDRIKVVTDKGIVIEISSASRDAIVAELHRYDVWLPALRAFERAGAFGPVNLDEFGGAAVIDAINAISEKPGGPYPGTAKLQRALLEEFVDD